MQFESGDTPDILQFSELDTINRKECAKRFVNIPTLLKMLYDANICTVNSKNSGACNGDSGKRSKHMFYNMIEKEVYH